MSIPQPLYWTFSAIKQRVAWMADTIRSIGHGVTNKSALPEKVKSLKTSLRGEHSQADWPFVVRDRR
jgi:hypothetical protein